MTGKKIHTECLFVWIKGRKISKETYKKIPGYITLANRLEEF
uniref:Uncharacterized protein n=1 Tax=uncultured Desulfobacterium sp. TaxID=201089 RepID=E1Y970_9BACT|nr:unknown protein [uncultured Desulfobacterium sp.]